MNLNHTKIILASQSPRRCELMKQAGFDFEVIKSDIAESIDSTTPSTVVEELSLRKADDVFNKLFSHIDLSLMAYNDLSLLVIGSDTIVSKDNIIMGKPKSKEEAFSMLYSIQNNTHQVYTGVTLLVYDFNSQKRSVHSFHECTNVTLYSMSDCEINEYISSGDCYDKAGGYGIQGQFAIHIKSIQGDYNNVVGLPIARLYQKIKNL